MVRTLKVAAAAGLLAATASVGAAAPVQPGAVAKPAGAGIAHVHGSHRSCVRWRGSWHRHNQWGEWRRCRVWRGDGRRPDVCVKLGPLWYCDY